MFNNPKMFRKLLKYPNIEVRVYKEQPLHAKGYLFKSSDQTTFVVGSSNLTDSALCTNNEWNIKLTSLNSGQLITDSLSEFSYVWDRSEILTEEWIAEYKIRFDRLEEIKVINESDARSEERPILPNYMQTEALRNLERLRNDGEKRALLISSTGTGKTYLSAFDVKNFNPKRALFIIHREQIAREAMRSFKRIIPNKSMGVFSGTSKERDADYVFTTVQTMSKLDTLISFDPTEFDYIVIDEAHRSGAESYKRIVDYFEPGFLLGMTATPERTDGLNIFETFHYNIAYEIRLQKAMEENMLTPFHYFGVTELTLDGELLEDNTDFNRLVSEDRVEHILENIEYYGYSGKRVKGLIFCSTNIEATEISSIMNQKGYKTLALSGANNQEEREVAIKKLTGVERELDYILTVDIFNEGIDIPEINQIVMIRPTESAIVFVQQLGRGLRKSRDKEYVNIIDFIGNYQKNFLIPIALSGDTSFEKDNIKRFMMEGNSTLPGSSTINFDQISKQKIYESIDSTNFSTIKNLRVEYNNLKNRLGRIPKLVDYINEQAIDPQIIFGLGPKENYHSFLKKVDKEYAVSINHNEELFLSLLSQEVSTGKRDIELRIVDHILRFGSVEKKDLEHYLVKEGDYETALSILDLSFLTSATRGKFEGKSHFETNNGITKFAKNLVLSKDGKKMVEDVIEYALIRYDLRYSQRSTSSGMVINERYSRKDMCKYFNWEKDMSGAVFGYLVKENTFPIFVTYHKDENISESINYDDNFINNHVFSWMSKNKRTLESKEIQILKHHEQNNVQISLFVKREDGEKGEFFYLGEMTPISFEQQNHNDEDKSSIVNVRFELKNPVREDVYHFLTES